VHCKEPSPHVCGPRSGSVPHVRPQCNVNVEKKLVSLVLSNIVLDAVCYKTRIHASSTARTAWSRVQHRLADTVFAKHVTARINLHGILYLVQADCTRRVVETGQRIVLLAKVRVVGAVALAPVTITKLLTKLPLAATVLRSGDAPHLRFFICTTTYT